MTCIAIGPGFLLVMSAEQGGNQNEAILGLAAVVLGALVLLVIQVYLLSVFGQSIGKKMVGTRIVKVTDGSNPGFVGAFLLRSVVPGMIGGIPYVGGCFSLVNILCIFGEERRCIHDHIAGTRVVEA